MLPRWFHAIGARTAVFLLSLVGAMAAIQLLLAFAPGDAIDLLPNATALRPVLAAEWGLDQPPLLRVLKSLGRLARGDLGTSLTYRPGAAVSALVGAAAGQSLGLLVPALLLSLGSGLGLGLQGTGRTFAFFWVIPSFLAAWLMVSGVNALTWAAITRGWLDRPAWFALPDTDSPLRTALAVVVLAFASGGLGEVRTALHMELRALRDAPFMEAARARGAPLWPHYLSGLLGPLALLMAERVPYLLSGLVVVEKVLLFNGCGAMLWQACRLRDYPLATALTAGAALLVCSARLIADLIRVAADPRLRT